MAKYEYDLEERLIEYGVMIIRLTERLNNTRAANHIGGQLLRSGTSPTLNHGEAEAAESDKDFLHKLCVCQKELKESRRALELIKRVPLLSDPTETSRPLSETEELIRIFGASIGTTRLRLAGQSRSRK